MLKKKISRQAAAVAAVGELGASPEKRQKLDENNTTSLAANNDDATENLVSTHFPTPLWMQFYEIEQVLNKKLQDLSTKLQGERSHSPPITHIYNPLEYAAEVHVAYLRRYLNGPKRVMFLGMNPGPNGMGQTGVPFGNIGTVRDVMKLAGTVGKPEKLHPKRNVNGFGCTIEEPSGVRIWNLFQRLAGGTLDVFARQCFVHNFCPLAFFDKNGKNITPNELKGNYKSEVRDLCLETLNSLISIVQVEILVGVGDYVFTSLKKFPLPNKIVVLKIPHPSPRSLNNQNWPEKAEKWLEENDLLKYIRNEA